MTVPSFVNIALRRSFEDRRIKHLFEASHQCDAAALLAAFPSLLRYLSWTLAIFGLTWVESNVIERRIRG
jgi:hypothetical protein